MNKSVNSPGRYKNYKYIWTQHQSIQIYEANIDRTEGRIYSNTVIIRDFNTQLSVIGTVLRQISKGTEDLNNTIDKNGPNRHMQDITQQHQNIHSSQAHREYSPVEITC